METTTAQPTEQQTVFDPIAGAKMLEAIDHIRRGYEAEAHRAYTLAQAGQRRSVAYHNAVQLARELLDSLGKNQSVFDVYEQITAPDVVVEIVHDRTYDDWIPARAWGWQIVVDGLVGSYHYHAAPTADRAARAAIEYYDEKTGQPHKYAIVRPS